MPRKTKAKRNRLRIEAGSAWFLAILLISAVSAIWDPQMAYISWTALVLGICGAIVAMLNIRVDEERDFLIGVTALIIILFAMNSVATLIGMPIEVKIFFINLLMAFSISGFIVALSHIAKLGLKK